MTKIAFIGGGSVQWAPELINDMALTPQLHGAQLILQDIDAAALQAMLPAARRIIGELHAGITVEATLDRQEALHSADFVILCVAIGGLEAMRADLEIPARYGIAQAVGDTVGPGGWARGLRNIPFAVQLASEMEQLCPQAWLLNLTNPMTTLCRAVTHATRIRTIGLCHEVAGVRRHLADIFQVEPEQVYLKIAGINHLPVILECSIQGQDGLSLLREWLAGRDILGEVERGEMASVFEVFNDQLAVKWTLFRQLGVLFGAGDRHIAEFFPGFLTSDQDFGLRFGVRLTTIEQRQALRALWQTELAEYTASSQLSGEQLAPLMGALLGGPAGVYVVNIPNLGQVDNLPRQAVVECQAYVDATGVHPLAVGELPPAVHAVLAPHVDRQELIVAAALQADFELAQAALATDPLVRDPQIAPELARELWAANQRCLAEIDRRSPGAAEIIISREPVSPAGGAPAGDAAPIPAAAEQPGRPGRFSIHTSPIRQLLQHPPARQVLEKHFPGITREPRLKMAYGMTLEQVAPFARHILTREKLEQVEAELQRLEA